MEIENLKICRDGEKNRMPIRILRVAHSLAVPCHQIWAVS